MSWHTQSHTFAGTLSGMTFNFSDEITSKTPIIIIIIIIIIMQFDNCRHQSVYFPKRWRYGQK
jgi:hypothetical protein